jgi:hypothetical protein
MADYPKRDNHFAHKLIRLMIRVCAAQEIGTDGFMLVSIIAHTEDAKRYTAPVTFWNDQLQSVCGFSSWGKLDRARKRAVASGWLHYEEGAKGKVGRYWATTPVDFQDQPNGPADCDYPHVFLSKNGEETGKYPGDIREVSGGEPGENRGASGEHSTLSLILPPPPPQCADEGGDEGELTTDGIIRLLRRQPWSLRDAKRCVTEAVEAGVHPAEIQAIADHWKDTKKWERPQLHERIRQAMPGENPAEHWPPSKDGRH